MPRYSILIILALLPGLALAQASFEKMKGRGQIVVNYRDDAAPFSYADGKKQAIGYSLEFCNAMVAKIRAQPSMAKLKVAYTQVPVDRMFTNVNEGSADLLCSGTSDTAERRNLVAFSPPIYFDGVGVMVRKKDNIASIDQLKGKKVALIKATTAAVAVNDYLKKSGGGWKLEEVLNAESALSQLQLGWSAGYARDRVPLAVQRAGAANAGDYAILPDRLSTEAIAIAYRKDDKAMQTLVEATVAEAISSGKAHEWHDKWFIKPIFLGKSTKALALPMPEELKTAFSAKK